VKAKLVRLDGTVTEPIDIRISVSAAHIATGRKMDSYRCPLAHALMRYFGPHTTVMVDWERITVWPKSKSAVVTCVTPPRLKRWMEMYDVATERRDFPQPLEAQFSAQLIYSRGDRAKVEEWCARWEKEAA
jgi:hypothetical protein